MSGGEKLVGALMAGIRVLRYLKDAPGPVGVSRVARDLSISPSTTFNLLRTLVHERLAVFDPERKTYAPGPALADLAFGAPDRSENVRLVRAHLREFVAAYGITAILWHRSDDEHAVLIDAVESPAAVRIRMNIGQRLPLLTGAMGRCFAAHEGLTDTELKARFERLRWQSAPTFEQYRAEIDDVGRNGYAIDEGDFAQGVTIIASPILGPDGKATMAISVLCFTAQTDADMVERIAADISARTRTLSRLVGGDRPVRETG